MTGSAGPSRLRRAAGVVGLLLASLAVALLAGEVLVRVFWQVTRPAIERRVERRDRAGLVPEEDRDLPVLKSLFELSRRNVRGIHKGLPFRTNDSGFRGPDYPQHPEPGVFRIVVGGDSVTMGTGVLEDETYAARLEQALNEASRGTRYEVLNLGLSGLNTRWVVNRIARTGMKYDPHLVVYGYTLNDIEGPAYVSTIVKGSVPKKMTRYRRYVFSRSYLLRAVWPRILALRETLFHPVGTLEHDLLFNYRENEEAWAQVTDGLDHLRRVAQERGLCVHVLVHTGIAQLNRLYPFLGIMQQVEEAARERGFTVTQTFPYFEGKDPVLLRLSLLDPHPNADGHAILAQALLDGLRELPERCWTAGPGGVPAALQSVDSSSSRLPSGSRK